jgi:hypothetical protein
MTPEVKQALEECRAAFVANPNVKSAWCVHHEQLWEVLTESYENRISYILTNKPESEHLIRFQNFRPCTQHDAVTVLDVDYAVKRKLLYADYTAKCAPLDADYAAKCASLDADYTAKYAPIYADYEAKCAPLDDDYTAKCAPIYADYEAKCAPIYRADVPLGTWTGSSIFEL